MMIDESKLNHLKNLVVSAQNIIIVISSQASFDQAAAGLALAQALASAKQQGDELTSNNGVGLGGESGETTTVDSNHHKQIRLASPKLAQNLNLLTGIDLIGHELGHQSLTISFDYSEEKVDKISYHIGEEAGKFYLTVKPKAGTEPLDPKSVEYSMTGADADLLILFGVSELDKLDQLYFGYEELYKNTPLVSFHVFETDFGTVKIDTSPFSSTAEAVHELITQLGLSLSPDPATNILAGIEQATNCFGSRTTNAQTFAVVAELMKAGARRVVKPVNMPSNPGSLPKNGSDIFGKKTSKIKPKTKFGGDLELGSIKTSKLKKKPKKKEAKITPQPRKYN